MPAQRENRSTAMAIMPGASRVQKFSGNRHRKPITKIILHTTEGSSWPGYAGGGNAPHFTVRPGAATESNIRQHIDTDRSAKALVNRSGGVQTNNEGVIQIEYIGSCDRAYAKKHGLFFTENADDDDLAGLAAVLAWIHKTHRVPLTATGLDWPTTNAAYRTAPQRMSFKEWENYRGVCGHTHVPENDHWDPGAFPVQRLLRLAGGSTGGGVGSSVPAPSKAVTRPARAKIDEDGRLGRETVKAIQRILNASPKTKRKLTVDGRLGPDSYRSLQEYLGHPVVDGVIEHQSYKPAELGNGVGPHGWRFTGRGSKGSKTISRLQKHVGVTQDGVLYEGTTRAWQRAINAGKF